GHAAAEAGRGAGRPVARRRPGGTRRRPRRARRGEAGAGRRGRAAGRRRHRRGDPRRAGRCLMATITASRPALLRRPFSKPLLALAILGGWVIGWAQLRGRDTLELSPADLTPLHRWLNDVNDTVGANRNSSPIFLYFVNEIRAAVDAFATLVQSILSQPSF